MKLTFVLLLATVAVGQTKRSCSVQIGDPDGPVITNIRPLAACWKFSKDDNWRGNITEISSVTDQGSASLSFVRVRNYESVPLKVGTELLKNDSINLVGGKVQGSVNFISVHIGFSEHYVRSAVDKKCLLRLTWANAATKESKDYCLNLTGNSGEIMPWTEHDVDVITCVLGSRPCAFPKESK